VSPVDPNRRIFRAGLKVDQVQVKAELDGDILLITVHARTEEVSTHDLGHQLIIKCSFAEGEVAGSRADTGGTGLGSRRRALPEGENQP
jgi:hypothetical protein